MAPFFFFHSQNKYHIPLDLILILVYHLAYQREKDDLTPPTEPVAAIGSTQLIGPFPIQRQITGGVGLLFSSGPLFSGLNLDWFGRRWALSRSRSPGFSPGGSALFKTLHEADDEAQWLSRAAYRRGFASGGSWWSRGNTPSSWSSLIEYRTRAILQIYLRPSIIFHLF